MTKNIDLVDILLSQEQSWWMLLIAFGLIGPILAIIKVLQWSYNNWATHPIAESLAAYCNNNSSWLSVASDINVEYRRF